jgi:Tol biopolymer transport system component
MTELHRAVFLSYASEDAEAALRICTALRAAGIEVWFDQSELRGGDAWDASIRRQIKSCGLFIPIISRNTHLREEGYFRLEWKIAVDRSHLMSTHKAFLLPVVIDDTSDDDENVPERFLELHWTRLPGGEIPGTFVERVARLLTPDTPPAESPRTQSGAAPPPSQPPTLSRAHETLSPGFAARARKLVRRNKTAVWAGTAALAAILAAVGLFAWGPPRQLREGAWHNPLADAKVTRLTDFAGSERAAAISRDGRLVAFLASRDGQLDAWLTEVGSNRYRNLTQGQIKDLSNASVRTVGFSPDGALVTLWTRVAEGSRPEDINVLGAPIAGGPLRLYMQEAAEYDWSPDGKRLVFHTTAPGDPIFLRAAGEKTAHQIYVAPPGIHCHFPIWSTDGEFIYFLRGEPPVHWDVWRLRPSGGEPERITSHNSRMSYPVALDARTLMYLTTDADGSGPWLYVMDLPLKREHRVSFGLERYTSLAASSNGTRLVASVAISKSDLWRMSIAGDGPPQTAAAPVASTSQNAFAPRFGPGFIAYMASGGGRRGIWKLANGSATELWNDVDADRVGAPAIAPDGRIAFAVDKHGSTQLHVIDSDGGNSKVIANALAVSGDLAWTPDSQSLIGAIVEGGGEPHLARIPLDGGPPQPMESEYSVNPVWSPDGKYLVYSGADVGMRFPLRAAGPDGRPYAMASLILTRGARRVAFARNGSLVILRGEIAHKNFWLLDPKTGAERQLTDLPSNLVIGDFDVSPDGTEIIFDRTQDSSSIALIERAS